jgi:hypothetical protein
MIRRITNYNELQEEKERLSHLLKVQGQQVKQDIDEIKEELKPVGNALSTAALFISRSTKGNALANLGINIGVDVLIKKLILSRAGWITRNLVPYLVKNYASHIVEEPGKIVDIIKGFFRKKDQAGMEAV